VHAIIKYDFDYKICEALPLTEPEPSPRWILMAVPG